mgnify:CR=1 FL=1
MAKSKPLLARKLVSPLAALVDDRLSYQERSVLLVLYSFKGTQTYVYPSREQVAQRAGIGRVERIIGDDKADISISENVTVQVVQSTIQSLLSKPTTKK